jgi:hypothetical protein
MNKLRFPNNIVKQAQELITGWNQINPVPTPNGITTAAFGTELAAATTLDAQIAALEAQITDKRNQREVLYGALWEKMKRIRNVIKGTFGDDSSQYELVGGTRLSDRKPYKRRTKSEE